MKKYFEKKFELRYFEMNNFGEASPTTILALLEETAADHCYSIDYSLYDLQKQNIGWVLLSGVIRMDRYPIYKEKIIIRTWLSTYSSIRGFRENLLFDENRNIIGRSRGLWLFFDTKRRRPIQILDKILERWSFDNKVSIDHDITKKIEPIDSSTNIKTFNVSRYDVDSYDHVNNIRYLYWLMESMPEEIANNYYLHSIDGRFMAEAQYGDTLISFTEKDINDNSFIHTIKTQSNNKVCASAKTIWKKRLA